MTEEIIDTNTNLPMVNVERQESGDHNIYSSTYYRLYHYIILHLLTENILIVEENEENKNLIVDIERTYYSTDPLNMFNIGVIHSDYDNLLDFQKEMIKDMKNDNKNKCNYVIQKFENSGLMSDYINMIQNEIRKIKLQNSGIKPEETNN